LNKLRKTTRFDIAGLILLFLSITLCVVGLSRVQSNTEDVVRWLPDSSPARAVYDTFEKKFGSDDFLVVTWDGCTVDDPRLEHLCKRITAEDSDEMIQSIVSGADVIARLEAEIALPKKYIRKRFKGVFFGVEDTDQTLALIELSKKGSADRRESLRQIEAAIENTPNLDLDQVIFGGYPFVGISLDNQLKSSFVNFLLPSVICASFISIFCLRNIFLSSILLGAKFGGLMSIIPALVYILTTSGSIHLIHYSLDAIGDPEKLFGIGFKPCCISALTTAIGMLSLCRSSFPAIRSFGFFCALGAGIALLFQLIVVPWLLHRFGVSGQKNLASRSGQHRIWKWISDQIFRFRFIIAFAGIMLMVLSAFGLTRLSARVEVEKLFAKNSPVIASLKQLEARMGPLDQAEFLIEFQNVNQEGFHVRSQLVYKIHRYLSSLDEIGATHSLHNYLPREPSATRLRDAIEKSLFQKELDLQRDKLATSRFLNVTEHSETWRVSLRFPFTNETDVGHQEDLVIEAATKALNILLTRESFESITTPIRFDYTGKNHLFHSAQVTLLEDFYRNFILAFLVITPVLIVVLRSFWLGLTAMLPNLFPVIVLFGALGWLEWPVDLAIAMTASVALGIAVDDTPKPVCCRRYEKPLDSVAQP